MVDLPDHPRDMSGNLCSMGQKADVSRPVQHDIAGFGNPLAEQSVTLAHSIAPVAWRYARLALA